MALTVTGYWALVIGYGGTGFWLRLPLPLKRPLRFSQRFAILARKIVEAGKAPGFGGPVLLFPPATAAKLLRASPAASAFAAISACHPEYVCR